METNERMARWTSYWALADGMVVCIFCKKSQPMTDADEEFIHDVVCPSIAKVVPYPWIELHDTLDYERG
jgi:hypothetical protein